MMKILQINLNRCRNAHDLLEETVNRRGIGICLLSEPNKAIITRKKSGWRSDKERDTAVWWTGHSTDRGVRASGDGEGFSWLEVDGVGVFYSCYFSPNRGIENFEDFLEGLAQSMESHRGKGIVITGDFNAANIVWGSRFTTARGTKMGEWLAERDLTVLNDGKVPTFARRGQEAHIDLTAVSRQLLPKVRGWGVDEGEETMSDHRYIFTEIEGGQPTATTTGDKRWQWRKLNREILIRELDAGGRRMQEEGRADARGIVEVMTKACTNAGPQIHQGAGRTKAPKYWWNEGIAQARKECIKKRRAHTRERRSFGRMQRRVGGYRIEELEVGVGRVESKWEEYRAARKHLKSLIAESKNRAWRELIEAVESDVWGLPYRVVRGKLRTPPPILPPDVLVETITTLFPTQPWRGEGPSVDPGEIPGVTLEEIKTARERLATGKAPGPDGIPPEVARLMVERWPGVFQNLVNTALREGIFPKEWKKASLVLIPKPGKKKGPSAFRPICLLDTMGKLLENILVGRLNTEIEQKGLMSESQYGFRKGKSTIGAIKRVLDRAGEERNKTWRNRGFVVLVLLDVKNAFNTANWGTILEALRGKGISEYLCRVISSYLEDRSVVAGGQEHRVTAGVPQGSILGPLLWNLAYDGVLEMEGLPEGVEIIAYADDLAVMVTAKTESTLQDKANEVLDRVVQWMDSNHLKLAPEKTEALYLTGRKRTRGVNLVVAGHPIEIRKEAKYLGVILDTGLTGSAHVKYVSAKAQRVALSLARILPRVGGASGGNRRLLASVAESTALYAAAVWGDMALRTAKNRSALRSAQRTLAIRVSRGYRTVPTESLLVLGKMLPWDLLAAERSSLLLDEHLNPTMARRATIDAWQEEWTTARPGGMTKGSWTKSLIPDLRVWLGSAGEMTYGTAQVLTGHGQFQTYMVKIGKIGVDICVLCSSGETDDVEHTILRCGALGEFRGGGTQPEGTQGRSMREIVEYMATGAEAWREITGWFDAIMSFKHKKEKQRRGRIASGSGRE